MKHQAKAVAVVNQITQAISNRQFWATYSLPIIAFLVMLVVSPMARAEGLDGGFVAQFFCPVLNFLRSELAPFIFLGVVIVVLILGIFSMVDWAKLISAGVLMGLVVGVPTAIANISFIASATGLSGCFVN